MPGLTAGFSLIQGFALAGNKGFNLKAATVDSLLEELTRTHLYRHNLRYIRQGEAGCLLLALLKDLSAGGELGYFSGPDMTMGLAKALLAAISDMKLAGLNPGMVSPESFLNPGKGRDMLLVWREYERKLREEGLLDRAGLLALAPGLQKQGDPLYIIPTHMKLFPLEEEFLRSLAGEKNHKPLILPAPHGLEEPYLKTPSGKTPPPHPGEAENPYLWLCQVEDLPPALTGKAGARIFHAYGENSEIREILRRIREGVLPLDSCALYYTAADPYVQHLYQASQLYNLPVTFGEGVNIINTGPGRLLSAILAWVGDNYSATHFHALLAGPDLKIHETSPHFQASLARAFRSLNIGWGRERYLPCLERETARCTDPEKLALLASLGNFLRQVLEGIPAPDAEGRVDSPAFFAGLARLVTRLSSTAGPMDEEAGDRAAGLLEELSGALKGLIPLTEALLLAEKTLAGARVGRSTPRPGCLHADTYKKGLYISRPHVFIAGLDALRFPGSALEDPVLLDAERERLSPKLPLRSHRGRENLYAMAQLLSLLPGEVTLSYSSYDTVEGRDMFPSPLLLQVHRLKEGDPKKDYSSLAGELAGRRGFAPLEADRALDEREWWLSQSLGAGGLKECKDLIFTLYPGLGRGVSAHQARASGTFNAYSGKVASMAWEDRPLSASQLENLAACPFHYFLRYILGISPPEDLAYDPGAWLDPAARGTLLHTVFEVFYRQVAAGGEKPSYRKHRELLLKLAGELIAKEREACPPPHQVVYQQEREEMLESCLVFLKSEEALAGKSSPAHFELAFGLGGRAGPGRDPVKIELPSGRHFLLRGIIDRVDMLDDTHALILDYKTGSTYAYSPYRYYRGGRQLQHTLYAVALEKIFSEGEPARPLKVVQAGYAFPTLRGEGQRILRDQGDRSGFYDILELLHQILRRGAFTVTDDPKDPEKSGDCRFCDYPRVCRARLHQEALAAMLADPSQADLDPLRRLRNYG